MRINWRRVWRQFDEWCQWMQMPQSNTLLLYAKARIEYLVNAELPKAKAKKGKAK